MTFHFHDIETSFNREIKKNNSSEEEEDDHDDDDD